eukprot:CAMPEP_0170494004 /NCGR_PEP_ID=MMETSP0208-20121228/14391_1 /TAXON_ID=197538 /ORGANISM="Strombidium inclinatum, Strain S3" /LENGTH=71 /DNA_ID=CAMNT_0010769991 /DNA_START=90 /DNA_END=302 /DNA_ORIENTATION=-
MFRHGIKQDVRQWKLLEDELEIKKAQKKMRMLWAHLYMWKSKMREIMESDYVLDQQFKDEIDPRDMPNMQP